MLKRKLLKRALPILLSISMVFGSMPATAYASEYVESEMMEESALEGSETAGENAESSEVVPESSQGEHSENMEESKNETKIIESENDNMTESETEAAEQTQTQEAADPAEVNADAQPAALDTELVIEEAFLRENANSDVLQYDVDQNVVVAKYDEAANNVFGTLKEELESAGLGEAVSIKVDGTQINVPKENLNFQWRKKSGDNYVEMPGETPLAPNDYKLVISLSAIDGVCKAATAELDFTITKRQLSFGLDEVVSVVPGTTVDKFLTGLKENYVLLKEDRSWEDEFSEMPKAAKGIYIASFEAEVYDAHDAEHTALSKETVLVESGDYTVTIKAALKEAVLSTYELAEEYTANVKIENLIQTKVKVEQKNAGEVLSKKYVEDAPISYETDIKDKIQLSIVVPDENGDETKDVVIEGAQPTLVWCDADKNELGVDPEAAPVDAGTYYLGFQYLPAEEQQDIYKESEREYIKVEINPAPLTLNLSELTGDYFTGMTEDDVLKDADYVLVDEAGEEYDIDRTVFWGVSYDNPEHTQAYEPIFKLIKAEKDKDGAIKKDADGKELWTDNEGSKLDASKYAYRLQFTGKKAVYNADGTKADERDVNGNEVNTADINHCIVTTAQTLFDKSVVVPVKSGTVTKIDVSAILEEGVSATKDFNDLYKPTRFASKVYDGSGLYENRGAYKKASVTTEDGTAVASDYDNTLTYKWYRITSKSPVLDEVTGKQTGWTENRFTAQPNNAIPTAAGEYKLVISFSDIKNGYVPSTETLYYRIEKQLLVVSPTSIPTARKGETVGEYTDRLYYEEEHNIYIVPGNQYGEGIKTEENLLTNWKQVEEKYWSYYTNCYDLTWYVERLERNDDKTPKKDENGNNIYKRLESTDSFKLLDENYYRLGVELECQNSNYSNYMLAYQADVEKEDFTSEKKFYNDYADITVKEIGSLELEIEIDETKLASTVKDYDAKPFYATKEAAYADVLQAVTIRKKADGEALVDPRPVLSYSIYDETLEDYIYDFEDMVNAGTYRLELSFLGDETYAPCEADKVIEYTIKPLELKAAPYVYDNIAAGTYVNADFAENDGGLFNSTMTEFVCDKMPEEDKPAFEWKSNLHTYIDQYGQTRTVYYNGYAAYFDGDMFSIGEYHDLLGTVRKAGKSEAYDGYIRYNTDYTVQLSGDLAYPYSRNYDIKYVKTPFRAAFRGPSTVYDVDDDNEIISYQWDCEALTTTITPLKGIPYYSNDAIVDIDGNEIPLEGNYLEFHIVAPEEFKEDTGNYSAYFDDFVYKNSVKKDAKGYVTYIEPVNGGISVMVPADEKAVKSFEIVWENGYIETFNVDFTNAVFLDDLTKAVAPKSLAFNGVNTKMAVGDEQQLDVKIKKAQINDIIYLDYRVLDGTDVISVTSDDDKKAAGYVTALKVGSATVAAVPVKMENGEKTDIPGVKPATVKITVGDVAAPVIKKITAIDDQVDIEYVKPSNGYRREVYILEGGKWKEEDFKSAIQSMNNEGWEGIFAVQPKYYSNETVSDAKTQQVLIRTTNLKAGAEYTVYIRNVSGVRTLYDGALVTESAKGTVKSFKTTLPQVKALSAYFKQYPENAGTDAQPQKVAYKEIALTQKTEQLYASGRFLQKPEYAPADDIDNFWFELPLDTKEHKGYVAPKLTYWLTSDEYDVPVEDIRDFKNYIYVEGKYYRKTDIATIDKSGNIKLKGTGTVYAHVRDLATGVSSEAELVIYANANSMTGKGGKLAVGQGIYLSSLLTYSVDGTVILGYDRQDLSIPEESLRAINDAGNFSIIPTGDGDYFITALKPKMSCDITVTDKLVALLGGTSSVTLKLQSAPIEPVKGMKITDIVDNGFVINFTYAAQADNEDSYTGERMRYRIVITDARKSVVDSIVVDQDTFIEFHDNVNTFNADITNKALNYDGKKRTFNYRYPYSSKKIARLSNYSVSVTPIYGDDFSAKPAAKSVKTANFPASYRSLAKDQFGGESIYVVGYAGSTKKSLFLGNRPYLTSGNTYTLRLGDGSSSVQTSKDRMTDSLTWSSSDTKVAKVSALTGTYTASLNAVKAGVTVIEVSSKLTKKVIARYPVFIKAAGNAKDDYYGDYEYIGEYPYQLDPFYNSNIEVLTEANPVRVTDADLVNVTVYDWQSRKYKSDNYKWVKFTAPAFGEYTFTVNSQVNEIVDGNGTEYSASKRSFTIFEGQTYYFKVSGTFLMTVKGTKMNGALTTTDGVEISSQDAQQYIQFRASEDNYYTFYTNNGNNNGINRIGRLNEQTQSFEIISGVTTSNDEDGIARKSVGLHAGDVIYLEMKAGNYSLHAEKRAAIELRDTAQPLSIKADGEQWYLFTAPAAGDYTFKSTGATAVINMDYYESITEASGSSEGEHYGTDAKDVTYTVQLKEKQKVAIKLYVDAGKLTDTEAEITASVSVSAEVPDVLEVNGTKPLAIPQGSAKWVSVKLAEAGRYTVSAAPTEADASYAVNQEYYKNSLTANLSVTKDITKDEIVVSDQYAADAKIGDTIYIKVTTNKTGTDTPATANVNISLAKATAATLTADAASPLTVENGKEYWYTFTVPSYGIYTFRSAVTENTENGTHSLVAYRYESMEKKSYDERLNTMSYDFNQSYTLEAGEEVVLKVYSTDNLSTPEGAAVATNAQIRVDKLTAEPFTVQSPANVSLAKSDIKWYSFTALQDGMYTFTKNATAGTADIEMYKKLDGTGYIDMVNDDYSRSMREGEVIYFKVMQSGTDAAALTITASTPVIETLPNEPVSVTNNAAKYYVYTAAQKGRYAISWTTTPAEADVTVQYGLGSLENANKPVSNGYSEIDSVAAGTKIYLKVSTTSETAVSVSLKAEPVVPMQLSTTEPLPATAAPNKNSWYVFTATESGRYAFTKTDAKNNSTDITYYKDITNTSRMVTNDPTGNYFKTGESVYMMLSTTKSEQQTTSLKVEKITLTQIEAESTPVTINPGETKYYIFTASEEAAYRFDAVKTVQSETGEASTTTPNVSVYRYSNIENNRDDYTWGRLIDINRTESVTFVFGLPSTAQEAETFTLTYKNADAEIEWVNGVDQPKEVTINNGAKKLLAFEAPEDGLFAFSTENVADVKITPVIEMIDGATKKGFYDTKQVEAANIVKFYVGYEYDAALDENGTATVPESVKFNVKVSRVTPKEVLADASVDVTVARYEQKLFTFTAPEDGRYSFKADREDLEVKYTTYSYKADGEINMSNPQSSTSPFTRRIMKKDDKLVFALSYEKSANASESFKLVTEKLKPVVTNGTVETSLEAQESKWYQYTAKQTGTYQVSTTDCGVSLYRTLTGQSISFNKYVSVMEGDTLYLCLQGNSNTPTTNAKLEVTFIEAPSVIATLGESVPVVFNENLDGKWMAFTPTEDGFYSFGVQNGNNNYIYAVYTSRVYAASMVGETNISDRRGFNAGSGVFADRLVAKGDTVYVYVKKPSSAADAVTVTITKNAEKAARVQKLHTDGIGKVIVDKGAENAVWYAFYAPAEGKYRIAFTIPARGTNEEAEGYNIIWKSHPETTTEAKYTLSEGGSRYVSVSADHANQVSYCYVEKISGESGKELTVTITKTN